MHVHEMKLIFECKLEISKKKYTYIFYLKYDKIYTFSAKFFDYKLAMLACIV